jgi:hypothetical protein
VHRIVSNTSTIASIYALSRQCILAPSVCSAATPCEMVAEVPRNRMISSAIEVVFQILLYTVVVEQRDLARTGSLNDQHALRDFD